MIGRMKKNVKNLSYLWWIVLAGLVSPSFFSRLNNDPKKRAVAVVNGKTLDVAHFQRQYRMMQAQRQSFNQQYGLNLDINIDPMNAVERGAEALLLDGVATSQRFVVDPAILGGMIRQSINDAFGANKESFNVAFYEYNIKKAGMTVREFEEEQETSVRTSFVEDALRSATYVPRAAGHHAFAGKKSFAVLRFDKSAYAKQAKSEAHLTDEAIAEYFLLNKASYRLPDVKQVSYVVVDPHSYAKQVTVSDEEIQAFYNRRKETQFKEKDHYKMRRLLVAVPEHATEQEVAALQLKAHDLHVKIMVNKDEFAEIAKNSSDDAKTAKKGGMTEDFVMGTSFNPELEKALANIANNGDVTPLVRTIEGFECAQLVYKKIGSTRSLDAARKEIISALTQRKTTELLRKDIEELMRNAQGGEVDLSSFAEERHAKIEETGVIDASVAQGDSLKSEVARKVFGSFSSKPQQRGSFVFGEKTVAFAVTSSETDRYSNLESIKSKVVDDMVRKIAQTNLDADVALAQKAFFDTKKPLSDLAASAQHASFYETGLIKKTDTLKGVEKDHSVTASLFKLEDASMMAKVTCRDGDIILATQIASEQSSHDDADAEKGDVDVKSVEENVVSGFIASLKRNARIEVNDDVFSSGS